MGRSSKTSHVHYGSKDKNIATDELLNFRDASLDLHQLLGLGPEGGLPLVPRKLYGRHNRAMAEPQPGVPSIGGPSLQEFAAVVVGAVQDAAARTQDMLKQEMTKGIAAALVAVGLDRAPQYSAQFPTLPPLALPFMQPTDDPNMVRPAVTPTSHSSRAPIVSPTRRYSPYSRDTGTARAGHLRPPGNPVPRTLAIPYDPHAETVDTIDLQAELRKAKDVRFVQALHAIAGLSKLLHGHCGACWALTGRLFTNHHPIFGPCSLDRRKASRALNDKEYQNWDVDFQPFTACFRCYMPQVRGPSNELDLYTRTRTQDPVPNGSTTCTHPHLFRVIAWAVLKTEDLLVAFNTTQTKFYLDLQITPKTYAKWLATETDGIVNMGHLVTWLIEYHAAARAVVN
jgi:hypothetical protein